MINHTLITRNGSWLLITIETSIASPRIFSRHDHLLLSSRGNCQMTCWIWLVSVCILSTSQAVKNNLMLQCHYTRSFNGNLSFFFSDFVVIFRPSLVSVKEALYVVARFISVVALYRRRLGLKSFFLPLAGFLFCSPELNFTTFCK